MKNNLTMLFTSLFVCSFFVLSTADYADAYDRPDRPRFSIGVEPYQSLVVNIDDNQTVNNHNIEAEGSGAVIQGTLAKFLGLRGRYYDLEEDEGPGSLIDPEPRSVTGQEATILFGKFNGGFRIYGGVGYFTEVLDDPNGADKSFDISGGTLNTGLGWDWNYVTMDWEAGLRTVSDYEDYYKNSYLQCSTPPCSREIGPAVTVKFNLSLQI